jgi:U5 small nuclear ribonucleoprotein component
VKINYLSNRFISYLAEMTQYPELTRNIAIVGHLHHGKSTFMDMLIAETHDIPRKLDKQVRHYYYYLL